MSKKDKLIKKLKSKPKDFTFDEAETLLTSFGLKKKNKGKTSGSRVAFEKDNFSYTLHKPHPRKEIPMYQIIDMIEKLEKEGLI